MLVFNIEIVMKKHMYILMLVASFLMVACDSLDLNPEDFYGAGNFWKEKGQVESFIIGLHRDVRENYENYFLMFYNPFYLLRY